MIIKQTDPTINRPGGQRIIDASGVMIDLPAYIWQIRNEEAWHKSDRNSITVFKTGNMCIVLGCLREEAEMPAHRSEGVMSIQVIEGMLNINTDELELTLQKDQVIAIHKGCNYRIVAAEESIS